MTTTASATIVQCLWNYCNLPRDDGMSALEQFAAIAGDLGDGDGIDSDDA